MRAPDIARAEARQELLERCRYCGRPENLRATVKIALVVGSLLTGISEGGSLAAGHFTASLAAKVPLNLLVPFVVSNLGLLAARHERVSRRERRS